MGRMWPVPVVPLRCNKSGLDCHQTHMHHRPAHPRLHILEHPLDFLVELPRTDLATDVRDAERLDVIVDKSSAASQTPSAR